MTQSTPVPRDLPLPQLFVSIAPQAAPSAWCDLLPLLGPVVRLAYSLALPPERALDLLEHLEHAPELDRASSRRFLAGLREDIAWIQSIEEEHRAVVARFQAARTDGRHPAHVLLVQHLEYVRVAHGHRAMVADDVITRQRAALLAHGIDVERAMRPIMPLVRIRADLVPLEVRVVMGRWADRVVPGIELLELPALLARDAVWLWQGGGELDGPPSRRSHVLDVDALCGAVLTRLELLEADDATCTAAITLVRRVFTRITH